MVKSKCIFCKKLYTDILRHEDNCDKQTVTLIGPDYEKVNCNLCNKHFYRNNVIKWRLNNNRMVPYVIFGVEKHLENKHKTNNKDFSKIEETEEEIIERELIESTRLLPIRDYDYLIDENGKVYNKKMKEIKQTQMQNGSFCVGMSHEGEKIRKSVHYLVAEAFIENENDYKYVKHKDKNNQNNNYKNLEWTDKKEFIRIQ